MATKQAMISNGDNSSMDSNNDDDKFEDVELIVEDRRIRANSGILAYHSPVFASLLRGYGGSRSEVVSEPERHIHMRYPSSRYEFRSESSKAVQTRMGEPTMELVIPNYQYKDIKKALAYLVDKDGKKTMSGDTAWKLLPIAEEYKLKSIKKKCSDALMKSLKLMRAENEIGSISTKEILKYLACSEKHGFKKLKSHCIEECAANFNLSRRKEVINDKHITEATKLKILDKMSDNMTLDYENRLQQMHSEYERGYSEVNKKLKHQKEITDNWKEDMKQDVDAILSEATKAHKELVEDVEKKPLISDVEEQLDRLSEAVMHEVEQMKEQLQVFLDNVAARKDDAIRAVERARMSKDQKLILVEDNTDTDEKDYAPAYLYTLLFPLIRTFENQVECRVQIIEANANKFERNITTRLQRCPLEQIETGLSNQFILQDNYDRLIAEINSKEQIVTDANNMVEKTRLSHEKTKAELQKYTKKFSRVNTWIRWATPLEEDANKCLCFRHVTSRSTPRSAKR